MKTIPPEIASQRASKSTSPFYVLEIEFGGAVGTKTFSGRDLTGIITPAPIVAVTEWGTLSSAVDFRNAKAGPVSDITITLQDCTTTGEMLSWIRLSGIEYKRASIYIGFEDTGAVVVPLLKGMVNSPVEYAQDMRHLRIDLTDMTELFDVAMATRLTKDLCSYIAPEDEGKIAPICYGKPHKVKTVRAKASTKTSLSRRIDEATNAIYVDDAEKFPQSMAIKIRIGHEIIEGSFNGNAFTAATRGADVLSSITTQTTNNAWKARDLTLCGYPSDFFVNFFMKVDLGDGQGTQMRPIVGFDGVNGVIMYVPPFRHPDYSDRILLAGQAYTIGSLASCHSAGDEVSLVLGEYKWVVSDSPATALDKVYVRVNQADKTNNNPAISVEAYTYEHWAELDRRYYRVVLADPYIVPGKTVTSIAMLWEPLSALGAFSGMPIGIPLGPLELGPCPFASNELMADVVMPGGNHPADIMLDVLQNRLGVASGEIDGTSFTNVASETSSFEFNFALYDEIEGQEMLAQLAFQSCNALLWDEGMVYLKRLHLSVSPSQKDIPKARILEDTPALTHTELKNITTEVKANITEDGNQVELAFSNIPGIALYGRRADTLNLWCMDSRRMAKIVSSFWLYFWALPYELIEFTTPLTELELQNLDAVTLTDVAILPPLQRVRIIRIDHHPGHGENKRMDEVTYVAQVPLNPGCLGGCQWLCEYAEETACNLSGCEAGCEVSCTYACRQNCQHVCELTGCVSSCEMFCTQFCEFTCQMQCQIVCTTTNEDGCGEGGCGACELNSCQMQPCMTDCMLSGIEPCGSAQIPCTDVNCTFGTCVSGCTGGCEGDCDGGCQTGNTSCAAWCQYICVGQACMNCEYLCQTDCTACESSCTGGCTGCTAGCTAACTDEVTST